MSEEFNLEERVLCADDTCIGLVGPDGKCKVCGRMYQGAEPLPSEGRSTDDSADEAAVAYDMSVDDAGDAVSDTDAWGSDDRVLCSDDTCIGIIGPDGTCGTCGRPGQGDR